MPRAVFVLALLTWSAGQAHAQGGGSPQSAPPTPEAAADPVPGDAPVGLSAALPAAAVPHSRLGVGYLSAGAVGEMRGASTRGAIVGALAGGLAAGTFLWLLREEGGLSPWRDGSGYKVVFTGAVIGGLIGAGIGALVER